VKDFYKVLGVPGDAKADTVKAAYRNLAGKFHPDANKGNEQWAGEFMRQVNEAYAVLGDPATRARYDAQSRLRAVPIPPRPETPMSQAGDPFAVLIAYACSLAGPYIPAEQLRPVLERKAREMGAVQPLTLEELAEQVGFLKKRRGRKRA